MKQTSTRKARTQTAAAQGDTSWFTHDRFGLFIHWGLYALPARHEWVRHNEQITHEDYEKYFKRFDPDLYNPKLWAQIASQAGWKWSPATDRQKIMLGLRWGGVGAERRRYTRKTSAPPHVQ